MTVEKIKKAFDEGVDAFDAGEYEEALKMLLPIAQHGDSSAQALVADMYSEGLGVPQDSIQAVDWYSKAAEQGEPGSMHNLGIAY